MKKFLTQSAFAAVAIFTAFFVLACDNGTTPDDNTREGVKDVFAGDVIVWTPLRDSANASFQNVATPYYVRATRDGSLPLPPKDGVFYKSAYEVVKADDIVYALDGKIGEKSAERKGVFRLVPVVDDTFNGEGSITSENDALGVEEWHYIAANADLETATGPGDYAGYIVEPRDDVYYTVGSDIEITLVETDAANKVYWVTNVEDGSASFKTATAAGKITSLTATKFYTALQCADLKAQSGDDDFTAESGKIYRIELVDGVDKDGNYTTKDYYEVGNVSNKITMPACHYKTTTAPVEQNGVSGTSGYFKASVTTLTATGIAVGKIVKVQGLPGAVNTAGDTGHYMVATGNAITVSASNGIYFVEDAGFTDYSGTAISDSSTTEYAIPSAVEGTKILVAVKTDSDTATLVGVVSAAPIVAGESGKITTAQIKTAVTGNPTLTSTNVLYYKIVGEPDAVTPNNASTSASSVVAVPTAIASKGDLTYLANGTGANAGSDSDVYRLVGEDGNLENTSAFTPSKQYNLRLVAPASAFEYTR